MTDDALLERAKALHLHGLVTHWTQIVGQPWLEPLILWEEQERRRRSLERRLQAAHIGSFKPVCDFDWTWPQRCDRAALEALMALDFLKEAANVILIGPNGVGKSMWAQNLAHQALLQGATGLFTTAGQLLGELASLDSDSALRRRLRHYAAPDLLVIDEVGYLSYGNRHADLLFELVSRRYQARSTLVTTNRAFTEWGEVFPNAACVVSLIDRLIHNAEVIAIEGESYRLKEAQERSEQRAKRRRRKNRGPRMKDPHQPSGIRRGLSFLIQDDWTPEQAQAVFEVLDDLRERIWEHYAIPLQELYRQQRLPDETDLTFPVDPDEPF